MTDVAYRRATQADVTAMLSLWRLFWRPQPYEVNLGKKIQTDPDLVWIAESGGGVVGTIIGGFDGWWAWIYRVCVDPSFQRRGIAKRLLQIIHERLANLGADAACLVADSQNEPMASLLAVVGYKQKHDSRYCIKLL